MDPSVCLRHRSRGKWEGKKGRRKLRRTDEDAGRRQMKEEKQQEVLSVMFQNLQEARESVWWLRSPVLAEGLRFCFPTPT